MYQSLRRNTTIYLALIVLYFIYPNIIIAQQTKYFQIRTSVGYNQTNFITNSFFNYTQSGILKEKFGWNIGIYGKRNFILWDAGYFATYYDIDTPSLQLPEDVSIRNDGLGVGISLIVLPKLKYLSPLIGIEYQSSSLHTNESEIDESFKSISANTSGMVWKTGLIINFTEDIGLLFNYKQSFPDSIEFLSKDILKPMILFKDQEKAIQQISISFLFKIGGSLVTR